MRLLRYGTAVDSIFALLGSKEDDMTYALGFVASRSPEFARALVHAVGGPRGEIKEGVVRLQQADGGGRTDVEIEWPERFLAVFEAKRDASLPSIDQLTKYVVRFRNVPAAVQRLVTVTNAPRRYAETALPDAVEGIPVRHLTWRGIRKLALEARTSESLRNKHLLEELDTYLKGILGMESVRSNMVYVVSLSSGTEWGLNSRDVVNKHHRYFYPVSGKGGWPEPPNYIAFRYDGRLQTIHHVEEFSVFTRPQDHFPKATVASVRPHYLLELGPAIQPGRVVPTGPRIPRANRVWCMIDLLLTCPTITDALKETKRRLGDAV